MQVDLAMAVIANHDQIFSRIFAQRTSPADGVDLQMFLGPAALTSPAIPLEHLPVKISVRAKIKPKSSFFPPSMIRNPHCMRSENSALWGSGSSE
jgi:hypothetical protein